MKVKGSCTPMINVVDDPVSVGLAMGKNEILGDPIDDMILKSSLDDLMEQIG